MAAVSEECFYRERGNFALFIWRRKRDCSSAPLRQKSADFETANGNLFERVLLHHRFIPRTCEKGELKIGEGFCKMRIAGNKSSSHQVH